MWKWHAGERSASQHQNDVAMAIAAVANAAAIFITDTFTSIESAVAVFYVIIMLLAADFLSRDGIVASALVCALLSTVSFLVLHGGQGDLGSAVRLVGSLSALGVTTALLFRRETNRQALLASHTTTRLSEDRYRSIFQRSPVALWEQDVTGLKSVLDRLKADGVTDIEAYMQAHPQFLEACTHAIRSVAINDAMADMLGHDHDADVTGPIARLIPHDCPALAGFIKAAFEGQRRSESKGRIRDAQGRVKIVLMTVEFPEQEADLDRTVVGLIDISRQEGAQVTMMAAQSELARASRASAVGALSASVAHELSQPLGALLANAQACLRWLRRVPPDMPAANKAAERMLRDGIRASEIVKTTKSMLSRSPLALGAIELVPLVEETRALLEFELIRHRVTLYVFAEGDVSDVVAARSELQQVLINLVTNAIQAIEEAASLERHVVIRVANHEKGLVSLTVRDTGPGISVDCIEKIFTPYYTTKAVGMGMGLAICKSTVEAQGGQLTARNHEVSGAVFELLLPAVPSPDLRRSYDVRATRGELQ